MAKGNTASYAKGVSIVCKLPNLPADAKSIAAHPAVSVLASLFGKNPINVALDVIREQASMTLTTEAAPMSDATEGTEALPAN